MDKLDFTLRQLVRSGPHEAYEYWLIFKFDIM